MGVYPGALGAERGAFKNNNYLKNNELMKQSATENNKLIAEFMGMKYGDERTWSKEDGWTHTTMSLSRFKSDWSWLMPVVEKMCKLKGVGKSELVEFQASWSGHPHVTIREKSSNTIYNSYTHYNQFGISHWDVPLQEQIYSGIVEFILWYNKR